MIKRGVDLIEKQSEFLQHKIIAPLNHDAKVERNGKSRLSSCQLHNRRLSEFRIKRFISKAHRKARESVIFVVSRLKWMSAVVGLSWRISRFSFGRVEGAEEEHKKMMIELRKLGVDMYQLKILQIAQRSHSPVRLSSVSDGSTSQDPSRLGQG
jgi:hypothetical protein